MKSRRKQHSPRPWKCTKREAIYCPHHGDCTCGKNHDRKIISRVLTCPLHGETTTHPNVVRMVN